MAIEIVDLPINSIVIFHSFFVCLAEGICLLEAIYLQFIIFFYDHRFTWVNYNDLTAISLEIMVNKGNHPQMALIQVSEI